MRRKRRKPMHYHASCLYDGTIVAAFPIRKPTPKKIKQDNIKVDEDGVCDRGWYSAGRQFSDVHVDNRFRFMDIMANRLNARRAMGEILMPHLLNLEEEMSTLHRQLDRIEELLTDSER
ncbi:MAG: hypothetical protein JSW27_06545 [Phycisphaerales bacterium]|nr:MAG: hypothetical protein JSW27_06545 [Phycisphaerales bacterium]